jgi:hypothetical protein
VYGIIRTVTDNYSEPNMPTTYYDGPGTALAEATGQALSAVHSILAELLKRGDLPDERRKFHQRDLNAILETAVWMDRNLGPG